ncbi:MAG TPA: diiron oxygenase [Casimicrobiaceae bacterium]
MASLAETPKSGYEDPLARIDWQGVDRDCWWLPPTALSLAGVPEFEALPLVTRRRLSQLEYVHLLETGLWLESLFIARLAQLADHSREVAQRARFLQEVREEAGHSLMFVELLERSGFGVPARRGLALRALDALGRLLPTGSALFWAMTVVGEELPDRLNRRVQRGVDEATLSAVVYRMAQIHLQDEAAHAAYSRLQCDAAARRCARWQLRVLAPLLSLVTGLFARYVYFPPRAIYERAGLVPGRAWRARALANPRRRAHAAEMLRPTIEFLRRAGWQVSSRYVG